MTIKGDLNNLLLFAKRTFLNTNLKFTSVGYLIYKQEMNNTRKELCS